MRLIPLVLLALPVTARAQSLLDRPPNVSGDWVASGGTVQLNFTHRFTRSAAPERKVSNFPTFLVGIGLPQRTMIGFTYATNSTLAARYPNEWEFYLRHALLRQRDGAPIDLGGQVGYNLAAEGVDGEVSIARRQSALRVIGVGRVISDPFTAGRVEFVVGGGATLRLTHAIALAGDYAVITNKAAGKDERNAWSAGVHIAIPNTPHTFSLQATNTNTSTLQGLSRGESRVRYGFEFTIPFLLARYLGHKAPKRPPPAPSADSAAAPAPAPATAAAAAPAATGKEVHASLQGLGFLPKVIEVVAGSAVVWRNDDPMAHTVTAVGKGFDSGLIDPGGTWKHVFTTPGTYEVTCGPHPFMTATVVVKAAP